MPCRPYWCAAGAFNHGANAPLMPESSLTERLLFTQFLDALRELPEVHAGLDHFGSTVDRGHDAQIDLKRAGKSFILLVEAKKAGYPRDARRVSWQFR